jgi:hypothetical protein
MSDQCITEEIREENFKFSRIKWKSKHNLPEPLDYSKGNSDREIYNC